MIIDAKIQGYRVFADSWCCQGMRVLYERGYVEYEPEMRFLVFPLNPVYGKEMREPVSFCPACGMKVRITVLGG